MGKLDARTLWRMGLRANLLQATWNFERQQGIGWAWSLKPALDRLYHDPALRSARLAEHTAYFNTQPTLGSLALGAVAALEERRAAGEGVDADAIARMKGVLGSALAALGDRLFWFTLRPFAACLGVLLALTGSAWGGLALWVSYNLLHLGVRFLGPGWGYREGPAVMTGALRGRLERLIGALCDAGAALVGVVTAFSLVSGGSPRSLLFEVTLAGGMVLGLIAALRPRPSPTQWALGLGALCMVTAWIR